MQRKTPVSRRKWHSPLIDSYLSDQSDATPQNRAGNWGLAAEAINSWNLKVKCLCQNNRLKDLFTYSILFLSSVNPVRDFPSFIKLDDDKWTVST